MGRKPRHIDQQGRLTCPRCSQVKHITEFYQHGGAYVCVRNQATGIDEWFGKPMSWCKQCLKAQRKEQQAEAKRRDQELQARLFETSTPDITDEEIELLTGPIEPEPMTHEEWNREHAPSAILAYDVRNDDDPEDEVGNQYLPTETWEDGTYRPHRLGPPEE